MVWILVVWQIVLTLAVLGMRGHIAKKEKAVDDALEIALSNVSDNGQRLPTNDKGAE